MKQLWLTSSRKQAVEESIKTIEAAKDQPELRRLASPLPAAKPGN